METLPSDVLVEILLYAYSRPNNGVSLDFAEKLVPSGIIFSGKEEEALEALERIEKNTEHVGIYEPKNFFPLAEMLDKMIGDYSEYGENLKEMIIPRSNKVKEAVKTASILQSVDGMRILVNAVKLSDTISTLHTSALVCKSFANLLKSKKANILWKQVNKNIYYWQIFNNNL